ncbi:MAG TPA: Ig-like domain-containing protein [Microcella sp.]|nr:Ig-like domain-containing protein [Microcella sp.]
MRVSRGAAVAAVTALVGGSILAAPTGDAAEAAAVQQIDFTSASPTPWVVPEGVQQIQVFVAGGGGGNSTSAVLPTEIEGGAGRTVLALIDVTPGEQLVFQVGQSGGAGFSRGEPGGGGAGWRTGGAGNTGSLEGRAGGGGGGASAVLRGGAPLIVAAGGGGAGGDAAFSIQRGGVGGPGGFAGQNGQGAGNNGGGAPGAIEGGNGEQGDDAGSSSSGGGGGGGGAGLRGGARGGGGGAGGGAGGGGGGGSTFTADGVTVQELGFFLPESRGIISVAFTPVFATTTEIVPIASEVVVGAPTTIDVTVTSSQPGLIATGEVDLYDGDRLLGTQALLSGVATFSGVTIGLGERMLFADYRPVTTDNDPADLLPSSDDVIVTGLPVATSTTLGLSTSSVGAGDGVTITADVAIAGLGNAVLTGVVELFADDEVIATVPVSNAQRASTTLIGEVPGERVIVARYRGAVESLPSESTPAALLVSARPTTVRVQAPGTTYQVGEEVLVFARVERSTASNAALTGTVQFELDGVPVGSPQLVVDGQARLSLPSVQAGVRAVTAVYSGDTVNARSVSDPTGLRVQPAPPIPQLSGTGPVGSLSGPSRRGASTLPATGSGDVTGIVALMGALMLGGVALRFSARPRRATAR